MSSHRPVDEAPPVLIYRVRFPGEAARFHLELT